MSINKLAAASFDCGITLWASGVSAHLTAAAIANDHVARTAITDSHDIIDIAKKKLMTRRSKKQALSKDAQPGVTGPGNK